MSDAIMVALITGGLSLVGVFVSNISHGQRMDAKLEKQQAITDTKLDTLTDEVRRHNNFAQRMPVVEEKIKAINHRLDDLEKESDK